MTSFILKKNLLFFKRLVPSGFNKSNQHLIVVDGYGSHFTLRSNLTSVIISVEYDHIISSHISCLTTPTCELLQASQI
jgi:hypothetical protein